MPVVRDFAKKPFVGKIWTQGYSCQASKDCQQKYSPQSYFVVLRCCVRRCTTSLLRSYSERRNPDSPPLRGDKSNKARPITPAHHFRRQHCQYQPPIIAVGQPSTIMPPCSVGSPIRAAGWPAIITLSEPLAITSGGPTQIAMSPTRAAGRKPINTVGQPRPIGPPTCGIGGTPGVAIGQVCMSLIRAAGGMVSRD